MQGAHQIGNKGSTTSLLALTAANLKPFCSLPLRIPQLPTTCLPAPTRCIHCLCYGLLEQQILLSSCMFTPSVDRAGCHVGRNPSQSGAAFDTVWAWTPSAACLGWLPGPR